MSKKRDRNRRKTVRPVPASPAPAESHAKAKKRVRDVAEHDARILRIKRGRSIALFLGVAPLAGLTACDIGLAFACLPREIYLGIWAAIVGAVIGLSIRLVLERRRFQQRSHPG